jgi:DNA-binding transcriptional MerR regulator
VTKSPVRRNGAAPLIRIGDLARSAGISVRSIRYYEELGLVSPESHSKGGFRLYGEECKKRLQVIRFLKEMGLSLTEIQQIFLAKKTSGGGRTTVDFLIRFFSEKLALITEKMDTLSRMQQEISRAVSILHACESCDHKVLLDALSCSNCAKLLSGDSVPDTFKVILQ